MHNESPNHRETLTELIVALILALVPYFETLYAEAIANGQKPTRTVRELARMARMFRKIAPRYGIPDSAFIQPTEAQPTEAQPAPPAPNRATTAPSRSRRRPTTPRHTRAQIGRPQIARAPSARPQPRATRITPSPTRTLEL